MNYYRRYCRHCGLRITQRGGTISRVYWYGMKDRGLIRKCNASEKGHEPKGFDNE